jgi:hypothetical protein
MDKSFYSDILILGLGLIGGTYLLNKLFKKIAITNYKNKEERIKINYIVECQLSINTSKTVEDLCLNVKKWLEAISPKNKLSCRFIYNNNNFFNNNNKRNYNNNFNNYNSNISSSSSNININNDNNNNINNNKNSNVIHRVNIDALGTLELYYITENEEKNEDNEILLESINNIKKCINDAAIRLQEEKSTKVLHELLITLNAQVEINSVIARINDAAYQLIGIFFYFFIFIYFNY